MKKNFDAVIIGGGVMGCSIQYNLAEMGMKNTLLLEKNVLGSGSTSRSQAILRMHYSNEVTARLAWDSLKFFQNFSDLLGASSGYSKTGYLLIVDQKDQSAMRNNIEMQEKLGINTKELNVSELREKCPMIAPFENESYCWEPESGYADPYSVTSAFANRARDLGASIRDSTEVFSIDIKGSSVAGVKTVDGTVNTKVVVVAAGPWSGPLLKSVDVDFGLETIRHQVILLRRSDDLMPTHPIIGDVVHDFSARPDIGGITMIGVGEDERVGPDDFNQGVDMSVVERTMTNMVRRIPGMETSFFRGGWSGLFTTTPDWHPILDSIDEVSGLYAAVGFSGHGFKLSPMIGKVMAETILTGHSKSVDVSQLKAKRFQTNDLLESRYRMQVLA